MDLVWNCNHLCGQRGPVALLGLFMRGICLGLFALPLGVIGRLCSMLMALH